MTYNQPPASLVWLTVTLASLACLSAKPHLELSGLTHGVQLLNSPELLSQLTDSHPLETDLASQVSLMRRQIQLTSSAVRDLALPGIAASFEAMASQISSLDFRLKKQTRLTRRIARKVRDGFSLGQPQPLMPGDVQETILPKPQLQSAFQKSSLESLAVSLDARDTTLKGYIDHLVDTLNLTLSQKLSSLVESPLTSARILQQRILAGQTSTSTEPTYIPIPVQNQTDSDDSTIKLWQLRQVLNNLASVYDQLIIGNATQVKTESESFATDYANRQDSKTFKNITSNYTEIIKTMEEWANNSLTNYNYDCRNLTLNKTSDLKETLEKDIENHTARIVVLEGKNDADNSHFNHLYGNFTSYLDGFKTVVENWPLSQSSMATYRTKMSSEWKTNIEKTVWEIELNIADLGLTSEPDIVVFVITEPNTLGNANSAVATVTSKSQSRFDLKVSLKTQLMPGEDFFVDSYVLMKY